MKLQRKCVNIEKSIVCFITHDFLLQNLGGKDEEK